VVETLVHGRKRRRNATIGATVLAVMLLASTAWAAFTGQLPEVIRAVRSGVDSVFGLDAEDVEESPLSRRVGPPRRGDVQVAVTEPEESILEVDEDSIEPPLIDEVTPTANPVPPIPPEPEPEPQPEDLVPMPTGLRPIPRTPRDSTVRPAPTPTEAPSEPVIEPTDEGLPEEVDPLYRRAHHLHFVQRNPRAALAAWDRYLASEPRGRFALEARYNRAISLVRLGRRGAALAALRPFAEGAYRGYRQREARQLIEALEQVDSNPDP